MITKAMKLEIVEFIPEKLDAGVLYVCLRFKTAMHLCCCGCGEEVVTPLSPAEWQIHIDGDYVSLYPSIGNWGLSCKSHYWIRRNQVHWSYAMSEAQIARVRRRDQHDKATYIAALNAVKDSISLSSNKNGGDNPASSSYWQKIWQRLIGWFTG